jgi:hypothetical protein
MRRVGVGVLALCISSACLLAVVDTTHAGLLSVAVNDSYAGRHDRILSVAAPGVLRNDVDIDLLGGTAVDLVSNVSNGTLNLAANGGFTYAPRAGYAGQDSFRYRLRGLATTSASVTLTITNAPPLAAADTYTVTPGKTLTVAAPGVLGNDDDADGDVLTVDDHSDVSGSLDLKSNGAFSYTPNGGFSGSTTFTYTITDGIATSTATVTLTRAPVPSPTPAPTATPTPQPIVLPSPLPSVPLPSVPLPTLPPIVLPSLPLPTLPPVLPTASPGPSGGTSVPASSPAPAGSTPSPAVGTPPAQASGSPSPSQAAAAGGSGEPSPVAGGDSGSEQAAIAPATGGSPTGGLDVQTAGGRDDAGLEIPLLGSLGLGQLWWVPAATIGGPGLLVILFVALQLVGGLAWLPATRRFRRNGPQPAWIVTSATPPD